MANEVKKGPRTIGTALVSVMFTCLGVVELMGQNYIEASIWLSLAASLASLGQESTGWAQIPNWRKAVGLILLGASALLFGLQVGKDLVN